MRQAPFGGQTYVWKKGQVLTVAEEPIFLVKPGSVFIINQHIIAEIAKSDTIIYLDDLLPIVYDYFKLPVAGNSVPVLHRKQLRKSVCAKVVRNYRLPDSTIIANLFQCFKYIFLVSVYLELHILLLKVNLLSWHAFSAISLFSI